MKEEKNDKLASVIFYYNLFILAPIYYKILCNIKIEWGDKEN